MKRVRVRRGPNGPGYADALCTVCDEQRRGDNIPTTAWARRHASRTGHRLIIDREVRVVVEAAS